jgi:HK97 gp10 family phage protein
MSTSKKIGLSVSGLNEVIGGLDSMLRNLPQTRRAILTEGATFFKNDAVSNAHVITGKTKGSIKIESVTDKEAIISAGFGMPFEEKRTGTKDGTPHMTMTEAANNTRKEMPSIIKKHVDDLLRANSTKHKA